MHKQVIMFLCACTIQLCSFSAQAQEDVQQKVDIENGVSESLGKYRKQSLGNINYSLYFSIPLHKKDPIAASETITFFLQKNDQPLQLDFKENTDYVYEIMVNGSSIPTQHESEHLIISTEFLRPGENIIQVNFTAGDLSLNRNEDYLYTLLVPDRARTLFPCFDQPDLKATFNLSLRVPKQWTAVTNASWLESTQDGEFRTFVSNTTGKISTYLFSFVAGKFVKVQKTVSDRRMTFYYRETDAAKIKASIGPVFQLHANALGFLEKYTGIPYPFEKFDFIAIPDFQYNGMEHPGAIQYRASSLFLDSAATKDEYISRANLIAHETSHMWFGDLVTMEWFNDVWMKEVFANFIADKVTHTSIANMNLNHKFLLDHIPAAYSVDRSPASNPIRQPLKNLNQAGSLYGNIIYHKAPVMMRQLEMLMGEKSFRLGVRSYLKTYAHENATWPQLISVLDKFTDADLESWNKVWVDQPRRPKFTHRIKLEKNKIYSLIINQKGEDGSSRVWPQIFEILLAYPGQQYEQLNVLSAAAVTEVKSAHGNRLPEFILFNSNGYGYGRFPVDTNIFSKLQQIRDPVMRATSYINFYENMLDGTAISPARLLSLYLRQLSYEQEELNIGLLTTQLTDIFWKYISQRKRNQLSVSLEKALWKSMEEQSTSNKKKLLFRAFQSVAINQAATDSLFTIWKDQKPPKGISLSEDDYTSLALSLALRDYQGDILKEQLSRIKNADRKARFRFLMPALSSDRSVRDSFFQSLKLPVNREKEAWVVTALQYLHHPLRAKTSWVYVKESLEMLEEIQSTGDIFFPQNWLLSILRSYQESEVAAIVRNFIIDHPSYNPMLKMKILQAADGLFRAEKLIKNN